MLTNEFLIFKFPWIFFPPSSKWNFGSGTAGQRELACGLKLAKEDQPPLQPGSSGPDSGTDSEAVKALRANHASQVAQAVQEESQAGRALT